MVSNKIKNYSNPGNLLHIVLISLAVFTFTPKVYSSEPREFLTGEEIIKNHQILKEQVDQCYSQISGNTQTHYQEYFPQPYPDFDFQKGVNFCAGGIQWLMKKKASEEYTITDFFVFKGKTGKFLIFSNTSTYQWTGKSLDDYQILSWPYEKKRKVLELYDASFIDSKHKQLKQWRSDHRKKFDNYYIPQLFPLSCQKKRNGQQILDTDISTDLNNTKTKYFLALDQVDFPSYDNLFSSDSDPAFFLGEIPEWQNHTHSEPLFCWWIYKNLASLKAPIHEGYEVVCPIISLYTERQTCLIPCEQIVQKCATNTYIPLISFTAAFERNKEIMYEGIKLIKLDQNEQVSCTQSVLNLDLMLHGSLLQRMISLPYPSSIEWDVIDIMRPRENIQGDEQHFKGIKRLPIQFKLN